MVRRHMAVTAMCPGIILVRFDDASNEWLASAGFTLGGQSGVCAKHTFSYASVDQRRHIVGLGAYDGLVEPVDVMHGDKTTVALINGGFYNMAGRADATAAYHATIGASRTAACSMPSLHIPEAYKNDYVYIELEDGSSMFAAPQLGKNGNPMFMEDRLNNPAYRVPADFDFADSFIAPGTLRHAADRNPRSAVSLPSEPGRGRARLVVGLAKARGADQGYSLVEWSRLVARIDRLASPANASFNLDGGFSASLVVRDKNHLPVVTAQATRGRPVANVIKVSMR